MRVLVCLFAATAIMFPIPVMAEPYPLWDSANPVPKADDIPVLQGVTFHTVKAHEPEVDGFEWLHGAAVAWYKGRLFVSFGHNKGNENTAGEEAKWRVSDDGGKTWSPVRLIDRGDEPVLAVSHGVFFSKDDELWAFHGAFSGSMEDVHTRAYLFDETAEEWVHKGEVLDRGFWPMQEPRLLGDGSFVMAGFRAESGNPPAVGISQGGLLEWHLATIPVPDGMKVWGESTLIRRPDRLLNVARFSAPWALASESRDGGDTWTDLRETNLPMAASKPYSGTLSTGHGYLIGSISADGGNRRSPLTIALADPGTTVFSKLFVIRHAVQDGASESTPECALSYPYAVEHDGALYVIYSADGGRRGNRNAAELAVIPLHALTGGATP